mgnify:CR=1 FL=1
MSKGENVMPTIYQDKGYKNRLEYLESLAEEYGVDISTVFALANVLGPEEDFDGLVSSLQDESEGY